MKQPASGENSPPACSLIISIRGLPNGITFRVALTSLNLKGTTLGSPPKYFLYPQDLQN